LNFSGDWCIGSEGTASNQILSANGWRELENSAQVTLISCLSLLPFIQLIPVVTARYFISIDIPVACFINDFMTVFDHAC